MSTISINLIADDADGTLVLFTSSDENSMMTAAREIWTELDQYPNKAFRGPTDISDVQVSTDGELGCQFVVCYPVSITSEVINDWIKVNRILLFKNTPGTEYRFH